MPKSSDFYLELIQPVCCIAIEYNCVPIHTVIICYVLSCDENLSVGICILELAKGKIIQQIFMARQ